PEVDHVDAQLRVDHVAHSLLDVLDLRRGHGLFGHFTTPSSDTARAVASLNAIHDSSAHFTRAGYLATPPKATPSSSSSSSPSTSPRPAIIAVKASTRDSASWMVRPTISS